MALLNLKDLEFTPLDHKSKEKSEGLRGWFFASMEFYPNSFKEISRQSSIAYMTLWNFTHKRSLWMSYKNMCKLRTYIKSLMVVSATVNTGSVDNTDEDNTGVDKIILDKVLTKEDFFEG